VKPDNKYVLFGPPASGKSSLVKLLPTLCPGSSAFDLERVNIHDRGCFMRALANYSFDGPVFIAVADLHLDEIPDDYQVVFLLPACKEEYLRHVRKRIESEPEKAGQDEEMVFEGMSQLSPR